MNILDKIIARKREEVAFAKSETSIRKLEQMADFQRDTYSFIDFVKTKSGLICEYKRKSPSKGIINATALVEDVVKGYVTAGASAVSVLTDVDFFGGSNTDLQRARAVINAPILRKDFTIDEYQIIEAKALGADLILLIAECLTKQQVKDLAACAKNLGLYVLMEIHTEDQLEKCCDSLDAIGVNNRNLKTFEVNVESSLQILPQIPNEFLKISESGISEVETVKMLRKAGFDGFLIGENFMKTADPAESCREFILNS
jgi:indole-3-glycerol phosphate synthase